MSDRRLRVRTLLRPRWIAGHVLVAVAVFSFVQLGSWQLRRLDDKRDFNSLVAARSEEGFVPIEELLARFGADPALLEMRRVSATGRYLVDEEVIVQARSHRGRSGHHVATPLVLDDGRGVIVNRGWVPIDASDPPVAGAEPGADPVVVRGVIRKPQLKGRFGPTDPAVGTLERVARVDVPRLQQQSTLDLLPFYVELEEQIPEQPDGLPAALSLPELTEGSHFSYAVQWFLFALVAAVGYPILLWRTVTPARRRA